MDHPSYHTSVWAVYIMLVAVHTHVAGASRVDHPSYHTSVWAVYIMLVAVHTHVAGASRVEPPLLCPRSNHLYSSPQSIPQFIERNGAVVTLPSDHRLPLAHYLLHQQDLTYLKRSVCSLSFSHYPLGWVHNNYVTLPCRCIVNPALLTLCVYIVITVYK